MAQKSWHREEPREVRPFFQAVSAEEALNGSGILLFEGGDILQETSFELDEIDFKKLAPRLYPSIADPGAWMPAELKVADLELVLVARHGFLKRSEILHSMPLGNAAPEAWSIDENVLERLAGGRNLQLTLAICLVHDRAPAPGTPFVSGHWLARKSFLLRSRTMPTLFDLRTRNDEEWLAAGYPPKTFYAVDYLGGIDTELEEGASVATVWVHTDAHHKMVSGPLGESLQPLLASEIVSSIILESFKDWQNMDIVEPASPLATLLKQFGKEKPLTLQGLKSLTAKPAQLKATLQDRLSVVPALK